MSEHESDLDSSGDDSSGEEGRYRVAAILSEGIIEEPDGTEVWKYLVKWKNYDMHDCTWEPIEHFDETKILEKWESKKNTLIKDMGQVKFHKWMEGNEKEFAKAVERHDEQQKEEEKEEANGSIPMDDYQSDEDISRQLPNSESDQRAISPATILARREGRDESQLNSLFIGSQDVQSPEPTPRGQMEGGLFFTQTPNPRQPPLQQSGSSSSSEEEADEAAGLSDNSLMGELQQRAKKPRRKSTTGSLPRTDLQAPRRPVQSPGSPAKKTTSPLHATKVVNQNESRAPRKKDLSNTSSAVTNPMVREQENPRPKPKAIRSVNQHLRPSEATPRVTPFTHRRVSNCGPSTTPVTRTGVTSVPRSMQMNQTATHAFGPRTQAIKFVNQPKPKPRQWKDGENQFKTLHARHIADQRSRKEGTPELGALTFPAGAPRGLPRARIQTTDDNPYGRRETRPRQVQENDVDDNDAPRRASVNDEGPLKDWEVDKIPLVCPQLRLSNNCTFGARKCRYTHRDKDPEGRDYPVGDIRGWIPPKYRTPALTCPFWLGVWGTAGCDKADNACNYAHRNTGFAPQSLLNRDLPTKIDPLLKPTIEARRPSQPEIGYSNLRNNPSEKTCWYWAHGDRCRYTAENCKFKHHDTGIVADLPHHLQRNFVQYSRSTEDVAQLGVEDGPVELPPQPLTKHRQRPPPPPPPAAEQPLPLQRCSQMSTMIEKTCELDFVDMFTSNEGDKSLLDKRAFLIYHPVDHEEDLEVITRWLLIHHVEVGSPWYDGSWDSFTQHVAKGGSGVIIAHPDFEYFAELPDFGRVLQKQVRLWSVGVQEGIGFDVALSDSPAELRYDRIEIFPLGGFIYITEDVFERQPQVALSIVKAFFAKIEILRQHDGPVAPWHEVADACLLWRLCVRPELMQYLFQHCEKHAEELDAGDPDMRSRAELYKLLYNTNYVDQDIPTSPLSLIADKYPIISERGILAEMPPVDYFSTLKHSQEDANLHMIRYFTGLQVSLRRDYRRFYIVHTEPSARCVQQWKQEMQTVSEVLSPEKCLKELTKDGDESLIDFCERYMPLRKNRNEK